MVAFKALAVSLILGLVAANECPALSNLLGKKPKNIFELTTVDCRVDIQAAECAINVTPSFGQRWCAFRINNNKNCNFGAPYGDCCCFDTALDTSDNNLEDNESVWLFFWDSPANGDQKGPGTGCIQTPDTGCCGRQDRGHFTITGGCPYGHSRVENSFGREGAGCQDGKNPGQETLGGGDQSGGAGTANPDDANAAGDDTSAAGGSRLVRRWAHQTSRQKRSPWQTEQGGGKNGAFPICGPYGNFPSTNTCKIDTKRGSRCKAGVKTTGSSRSPGPGELPNAPTCKNSKSSGPLTGGGGTGTGSGGTTSPAPGTGSGSGTGGGGTGTGSGGTGSGGTGSGGTGSGGTGSGGTGSGGTGSGGTGSGGTGSGGTGSGGTGSGGTGSGGTGSGGTGSGGTGSGGTGSGGTGSGGTGSGGTGSGGTGSGGTGSGSGGGTGTGGGNGHGHGHGHGHGNGGGGNGQGIGSTGGGGGGGNGQGTVDNGMGNGRGGLLGTPADGGQQDSVADSEVDSDTTDTDGKLTKRDPYGAKYGNQFDAGNCGQMKGKGTCCWCQSPNC